LGQAGTGSLIGETATLADTAYSLTAIALGDVEAAIIDRQLFHRVAQEYPDFRRAVVNAWAAKLGATMRDLEGARQMLNKIGRAHV
jgi:CRP-like cAMP-binding protein